jgi:hypothetical protein
MSKYTPGNFYNRQNWDDLINRTINANDLINPKAQSDSRKLNENLKRTKRTLEPHLQEEADTSKIVGCQKKLLNNGNQTYKIGQHNGPQPQNENRKELLAQKMKSAIFQTLTVEDECSTSLIVHPQTIKIYDSRVNLDKFYYKQYKLKADYSSKIDCIPGAMNQQVDENVAMGKRRSMSSNAIGNRDAIIPVNKDYSKELEVPFT